MFTQVGGPRIGQLCVVVSVVGHHIPGCGVCERESVCACEYVSVSVRETERERVCVCVIAIV